MFKRKKLYIALFNRRSLFFMTDFEIQFEPIGVFRCKAKYSYDAARQGTASAGNCGCVELAKGKNFEQALSGICDYPRIWLVYLFDRNRNWKPMVRPPRGNEKLGVFATRAPYRPNPIGMSCVKLISATGRNLTVEDHDLLDGTPILDIKPYLVYADSFPSAESPRLNAIEQQRFTVQFEEEAEKQICFLDREYPDCIRSFLMQQLAFEPLDVSRKRVTVGQQTAEIAYRTWRAEFSCDTEHHTLTILRIRSGYSREQLNSPDDPYDDKQAHRNFIQRFSN